MADPGDQFIVACGIDVDDFGAHGDHPLAPALDEFKTTVRPHSPRCVGKEPRRAAEEVRIAELRAAPLLACHGMTGQKRSAPILVEVLHPGVGDL